MNKKKFITIVLSLIIGFFVIRACVFYESYNYLTLNNIKTVILYSIKISKKKIRYLKYYVYIKFYCKNDSALNNIDAELFGKTWDEVTYYQLYSRKLSFKNFFGYLKRNITWKGLLAFCTMNLFVLAHELGIAKEDIELYTEAFKEKNSEGKTPGKGKFVMANFWKKTNSNSNSAVVNKKIISNPKRKREVVIKKQPIKPPKKKY